MNPREMSLWPALKGGGEHRAEPRRAPHSTKCSATTPLTPNASQSQSLYWSSSPSASTYRLGDIR